MGFIDTLAGPLSARLSQTSTAVVLLFGFGALVAASVLLNVLNQLLPRKASEPPVVFHWFPLIGSTISYGMDPYAFFFKSREKYGDVFTFVLLGKKHTVCLGKKGNDFILNGKLSQLNAEECYSPLTTPVFGKDVVYDCPNAKLMEQKKFVKFGLSVAAFQSYVPMIVEETQNIIRNSKHFQGQSGVVDVPGAMAELTIYTASRTLQGKEVRSRFDSSFADLYHDLDMGFAPINAMFPWAPLPHNRRRDRAHVKIVETYKSIIEERRQIGHKDAEDMIWNLMSSVYKNGTPVPDHEVAHMMIALLMAGQHSSSSTSSWIVLRLAQNPSIQVQLLEEQKRVLGEDLPPLKYEDLARLTLHSSIVKETLRLHAPIHSHLRKVTSPMEVEDTPFVIPPGRVLIASPGVTARSNEHFRGADDWDPHRWSAEQYQVKEDEGEKVDYGYGMISKGANSPYLPFGAGRHRCIGEQFANLQLTTILATLVREMKVRNPTGKDGTIVGTDYSSLFSRPLRPAVVEFEKRKEKA